jgi:DNA-binding CsgD family transcriptional regulator
LHVEAEGYWGGDAYDPLDSFILGAIEQTIVEDNRPLSETRKRRSEADGAETGAIVSLDAFSPDTSSPHEDPWTLAAFDGIEDADALADMISRGGLTVQQADMLRDALERVPLTQKEAQVLDQLLQGFEPDDIARQRGIARSTVYNHFSNSLSKLSATA